ncbi:DNA polymerase III subunit delta' [Pseudoxanthomonas broegbernensis]|uniref:DNA-directed DNA polymerase n=1 Tax=Pseudoxanthomonas broegbernensis TaxID=83619 RepID=A0A7V8GP62_9GAMM|nr:DNA polymerase III subunit delta' [Pseudoxanthomonas broegbernensis]KAF1687522.1 DNA polymerase III subunit delta' [Pseudoxanthomonas broegbernensis]MBB6064530.1 DNA polymerase-3 subunit delta' [Pseudoxanthomonas broegbernensis]
MSIALSSPWQRRAYEQAVAALEAGRLAHGLLVCGPEGLGKRDLVEALAQYVLCRDRSPQAGPCGKCRSCHLFGVRSQRDPAEVRPDGSPAHPRGHSAHPDLIFVGYEWRLKAPPRMRTEIVIDQMRQLSERLEMSAEAGARVAIVEPADAVNYSAWNAILKTLEEPLPGRYLWLVASNPARLPATIRSRCQRLEMRLPPREEALAWLRQRGHEAAPAAEALEAARGHPGLADAWLRGDGLPLRRGIATDLEAIAAGRADPLEAAQRWSGDDLGPERLRHAAEIALAQAWAGGLTDPARLHKLAAWFDMANRARELLRSTVRADLVVAELLLAWRDFAKEGRGEYR